MRYAGTAFPSSENKNKSFGGLYTLLFLTLSFFIFSWFLLANHSLVQDGDGTRQHFRALVYYAEYLRQILKNLLVNHRLVIPEWDFFISEGADIYNIFHYYVLGDPINLLSAFVPTRFMQYFYSFACVLRLYLAGLSFSMLAFHTGIKNRNGVMAGALSYCFCGWALSGTLMHPYFVNPLIYFPLILLGIEKILQTKRPYLLILSVAVAAASNFYFFYMIVLLTVVYVLLRIWPDWARNPVSAVKTLLKIGCTALLGVCIAAVIVLPMFTMFLQDSRLGSSSQPFHWFYPWGYYSTLPGLFVSPDMQYWFNGGLSAPAVIACFVLLARKKQDTFLKKLLVCCFAILLLPIGGRILNGMSYMSNRWSWAMALLFCYILAKEWDALFSLSASEWKKTAVLSIIFFGMCVLLDKSRTIAVLTAIPLLFICLFIIRKDLIFQKKAVRQIVVIVIVCTSIFGVAFWRFSPDGMNASFGYVANNQFDELLNSNEAFLLKKLSEAPYTRYSGREITTNAHLHHQLSSTQYYWSLTNPHTSRFRTTMEMPDEKTYQYKGYDDRSTLLALSAAQYYVTRPGDDVRLPYGYEWLDTYTAGNQEYDIYENLYPLSLGYCYESYLTQDEWNALDPVQKQEVQWEAAYLNGTPELLEAYKPDMPDYSIPFEIGGLGGDVIQIENGFVTTAPNACITLTFDGEFNAETYVRIKGLDVKETSEYDLYFGSSEADPLDRYSQADWDKLSQQKQSSLRKTNLYGEKVSSKLLMFDMPSASTNSTKGLSYLPPDAEFSSGRHDYIVNMGYMEDPGSYITITFFDRGIYTMDALEVYCVPMDDYDTKLETLQTYVLEDIELDTNHISGHLDIPSAQLLCMAIPYSDGWRAFIDDEETEVFITNERYLGIVVPEGSHVIDFHYRTPFKTAGLVLSLLGIAAMGVLVLVTEKKRRRLMAA